MTNNDKIKIITQVVCDYFHLKEAEIHHRCRQRELCEARQWVFYFARRLTDASLHKIGAYFDKDHATVLHGCKTMANLIGYNGYETTFLKLDGLIEGRIKMDNLHNFANHVGNFMIYSKSDVKYDVSLISKIG